MAEKFEFEILTPESRVLHTQADAISAPGVLGRFGILARHAPMVASLAAGKASYTLNGKQHEIAIGPGFAEVTGSRVTLLVESASEPT